MSEIKLEATNFAIKIKTKEDQEMKTILSLNGMLDHGKRLALMGPSGCGKSTFLKYIAELPLSTEKDKFEVNGTLKLTGITSKEIAYLPQESTEIVLPWKRVRQQVSEEAMNELGLKDIKDRFPRHLSGGELRRVALGYVMGLKNKKAYLLDEPFNGLDINRREEATSYVNKSLPRASLLIFITHYNEEVEKMNAEIISPRHNAALTMGQQG